MNHRLALTGCLLGTGLVLTPLAGWAGANPTIPFYGSAGSIVVTPSYPVAGDPAHIVVTVGNAGDQPAANVRVRISYNDWGVTFDGWQEIATVTIAGPIPPGGSASATADHAFGTPTHTCVEALIVGADEDSNPADDRGQINLEVIGAGDTFSYGVPIRNNGDKPLELAILGHCVRKDAKGDAAGLCKAVDLRVNLEPGGEIRVPIELDLSDVAPGEYVDFVVDAVDAAGNHNHVVVRAVHETPLSLRKQALDILTGLKDQLPTRQLRNRCDALARQLRQDLESKLWKNGRHLGRDGGMRLLGLEIAAVHELLALLDAKPAPAVRASLTEAIVKLVDANRILAQAAIANAGESADDVADLMAEGDEAREQGRYGAAVGAYRRAWHRVND